MSEINKKTNEFVKKVTSFGAPNKAETLIFIILKLRV